MPRAVARNKTSGRKSRRAASTAKRVRGKPAARSKSSHRARPASPRIALQEAKQKSLMSEKKGTKHPKSPVSEESRSLEARTRKSVPNRISSSSEAPRLLRDSKSTQAALSSLEKGIKLIFQKEFKKARAELKALIDSYPAEAEILARARSYIQICEREEGLHKKPPIANDQLYTLGVMEHNRANYDAAVAFFRQSLENRPNADYVFYSLAASMAMKGSETEAVENLRKAIELNEDNRIYAKNDADFASLHSCRDFTDLVGISLAPASEPQQ